MEFRKVTISLPKNLYEEGMKLVEKGLFSNFSDLVRSGIREEFKEFKKIEDYDLYADKKLVASVKQSMEESKQGKGKNFKSKKELDRYFKSL